MAELLRTVFLLIFASVPQTLSANKILVMNSSEHMSDQFVIASNQSIVSPVQGQCATDNRSHCNVTMNKKRSLKVNSPGRGRAPTTNVTLSILVLLDLTPSEMTNSTSFESQVDGFSLLKTAKSAVHQVNRLQIVPGHHLELHLRDSKCDSGAGVDEFFRAIYTRRKEGKKPFVMLLGPHCSQVTESVASVTSYWNIVQVSHAATSAVLSDRKKYPIFYRTAAAESTHNAARLAFLRHFQWNTVSILAQNEDEYTLVVNDLCALLEDRARVPMNVSNLLTFSPNEFNDQLETLQAADARIIIGSFSPPMAVPIMCEVYQRKLYGSDHVWILPGSIFHSSKWFQSASNSKSNTTCTVNELISVVEGSFFLKAYPRSLNLPTKNFTTYQMSDVPNDQFHGEIYDAVWAMALGLRELQQSFERNDSPFQNNISLSDFNYDRKDIAKALMSKIEALRFQGATGLVSFLGANRIGTTALFQIQNGDPKQIGLFHPDMGLDMNCSECHPVQWPTGRVPVSSRIIKYRINTIEPSAFYTIALSAVLGMILALICLSFNLSKRKLKYIKLSSPKLNNIAIIGSILVYGAVVLLGIDDATLVHESFYPFICVARAYLLAAGFSLAFGAMFTKTFRVHRIFSRRNSLLKNKLLADTQLIGLILVLLLLDTLVIGIWIGLDPMERNLRNLTMEFSDVDRRVVFQPQVEVCRSNHTPVWLGILYFYKGLLLLVGVYMAWETRHVAIPALNDSPYIGMNVYNVVMTSVTVVFCDSLLSDRATLAYVVVATLILISTTSALCLLFLPKFHAVWRHIEADPIGQGTGLKLEYNTRRMVVDDRKELLGRAEIMNRVYLRDISNLDADINRLERLLAKEELNSTCVEKLDHYNSAIQAEVAQLYVMLEQDDHCNITQCKPIRFDSVTSRSCISLYDPLRLSDENGTLSSHIHSHVKNSDNSRFWGSTSCIFHQRHVPSCATAVGSNSLITLLQFNVDAETENILSNNQSTSCFYQLIDTSLLGADSSRVLDSKGDLLFNHCHRAFDKDRQISGRSSSADNKETIFTFRV